MKLIQTHRHDIYHSGIVQLHIHDYRPSSAAYIHILLYHSYLTKRSMYKITHAGKSIITTPLRDNLRKTTLGRPRKTKTCTKLYYCQSTHPSRTWTSGLPSTECKSQCQSPPKRCSLPTGKLRGNQTPATQGEEHWLQEINSNN